MLTAGLTDEGAALYATWAPNPDEDTPHAMLRDWLQERAGEGDVAARARWEFVQVQERLAEPEKTLEEFAEIALREVRHGMSHLDRNGDMNVLYATATSAARQSLQEQIIRRATLLTSERGMLDRHDGEWRRGPKCERCKGVGKLMIERGSRVAPCMQCEATGDAGGLALRRIWQNEGDGKRCEEWKHRVDWRDGFPFAVHATAGEVWELIEEMSLTTHRPTDWITRVLRHHPIRQVRITDREPVAIRGGDWTFRSLSLPLLSADRRRFHNFSAEIFPTQDAARTALATRLADWVRQHATSPAPTEEHR